MANFTEQAQFAETLPKLGKGLGLKGVEKSLNNCLQQIVNRTRFLKENGGDGGGSGGFSFGGDWDATPSETTSIAAFNVLHNATITTNELAEIVSGTGFGATATNLSHAENTGTLHEFRVTAPDTSGGGIFFVVVHDSSEQNPFDAMNDTTATVRGVGVMSGSSVSLIRNSESFSSDPLANAINAGDVLKIGYRSDTSAVYVYNETQSNVQLMGGNFIDGFADGLENLSVYSMGAGSTLAVDFVDDFSIEQAIFNFDYPEDLTKTYCVVDADNNSLINGKLLKVGDFVNFIVDEDDEVVDVVVSRLVSDNDITALARDAATTVISEQLDVGGSIYEFVMSAVS